MQQPQQLPPVPRGRVKKTRSPIACKRCHDRRVRCDASIVGVPCSACVSAEAQGSCQLLRSKRSRGDGGRFSSLVPVKDHLPDDQAQESHPQTPGSALDGANQSTPPETIVSPTKESAGPHADESSTTGEDMWSKVVSHNATIGQMDGRRVLYVGEPWTLAYIMQWRNNSDLHEHHYQTSDGASNSPAAVHVTLPVDNSTPIASHHRATAGLSVKTQLTPDIERALVDSYFARGHVLYPIFNEHAFRASLAQGSLPAFLFKAVLFAGALHAADPIIYRANYDTRQSCLIDLYQRSKAAFFSSDDDGRSDHQLAYIQAAFLLHNMWLGPNATMDPWTWLGLAIRMAQNIGMHRSTAQSSLSPPDQKLWKRIWWCLHVGAVTP